jgi:hypothetical protein
MKNRIFTSALFASSVLLAPALALADDMYDKQEDAIEDRYERAKESCEQYKDDAQDACEAKAKANYEQDLLTLKKNKQDREEPRNPQPR